jgi:hypothetical protein
MTFLGVYLITSGRPRGKDDIGYEDEEEATIGLIDEEYHDEPIEDVLADDDRAGRKLILATAFDGKGPSATSSRRESLHEGENQSLTPRRLRTPSPTRRLSVAFEDTPGCSDRNSLLSNPWLSSQERLAPVEPLSHIGTIQSTPPGFLPSSTSTTAVSQLETPRQRPSSRPPSSPITDPRPSLTGLSRHSMSRMLPGPLISPLSSSLSAVVADSLRRGVGIIDGTPTRRRGARFAGTIQRSKSNRVTRSNTREDRDPDRLLRSAEPLEDGFGETAEGSGERKNRMRSFSDALGWLRTGENGKKRKDSDLDDGPADTLGAGGDTPAPSQSGETVG